jgi:transposase InsO family protein
MGYHVSTRMNTEFCLVALNMALAKRKDKAIYLIHHSDRGLQYCSFAYTKRLLDNNIGISMTQNGDPYENALAERMNRTFKSEFDVGQTFESVEQAKETITKAIVYYNTRLPHSSCNLLTPREAHEQTGELKKHWKNRKKKK